MKSRFVMALIICLTLGVTLPTYVQGGWHWFELSGSKLMSHWIDYKNDLYGRTASLESVGYYKGFVIANYNSIIKADLRKAFEFDEKKQHDHPPLISVPEGITTKQVYLIVGKYLEDNPELLDRKAEDLIRHAIEKAYPSDESHAYRKKQIERLEKNLKWLEEN